MSRSQPVVTPVLAARGGRRPEEIFGAICLPVYTLRHGGSRPRVARTEDSWEEANERIGDAVARVCDILDPAGFAVDRLPFADRLAGLRRQLGVRAHPAEPHLRADHRRERSYAIRDVRVLFGVSS